MAASGCHTLKLLLNFAILLLLSLPKNVECWDNDDLELFDLVEEVNGNFYELLDVSRTASSSEIKKAYRKKTVLLHPDKNDAEDAEEQFRKLVAVYEVLKDEGKREKYDAVLENGLPDWRQPVFYYRKARKLGLLELALILVLVITIGQYFVLWASYLEKRLTLESFFQSKMKKEKRGKKAVAINEQIETDMQEELDAIPTPKLMNLWPVTITQLVISIPQRIRDVKERRQAEKELIEMKIEEEKRLELEKIQLREELEQKKLRKKNRVVDEETLYAHVLKEADVTPVFYGSVKQNDLDTEEDTRKYVQKKGEWTDEDYVNLSKAYIRFPGGTAKRWEKIAEMVGRPLAEVTKKSKEMKGTMQMNLSSTVQGGTKNSMKLVDIKDEIISTADNDSSTADISDAGNKLRKRHKPTKDSAKTLTVTSNQDSESNSQKPESRIANGDSSSHCSQTTSPTVIEALNTKSRNQTGKMVVKKSVEKTESKAGQNGTATKVPKVLPVEKDVGKAADGENWSQNQQVILEWTLRQYPKGTEQRWEKVAEHIPGKTKEDCIARFKLLAELVKQKKQSSQS